MKRQTLFLSNTVGPLPALFELAVVGGVVLVWEGLWHTEVEFALAGFSSSMGLVYYKKNRKIQNTFCIKNIKLRSILTMLLVRSGLLTIGGGGASSSISELGACTGLWYECGAPSKSVGVVLLGLELDTWLNEEPVKSQ